MFRNFVARIQNLIVGRIFHGIQRRYKTAMGGLYSTCKLMSFLQFRFTVALHASYIIYRAKRAATSLYQRARALRPVMGACV